MKAALLHISSTRWYPEVSDSQMDCFIITGKAVSLKFLPTLSPSTANSGDRIEAPDTLITGILHEGFDMLQLFKCRESG